MTSITHRYNVFFESWLYADFIFEKFFSRQNRKSFFTNSVKVGLGSTFIYTST